MGIFILSWYHDERYVGESVLNATEDEIRMAFGIGEDECFTAHEIKNSDEANWLSKKLGYPLKFDSFTYVVTHLRGCC